MYFPYLRGKQFELIALRELITLLSKKRTKISPILEPVKESTTLTKTIQEFKKHNINFNLIINPKVGDMQNSTSNLLSLLTRELTDYTNYQVAIILNGKDNPKGLIAALKKANLKSGGLTLIHNSIIDNINDVVEEFNDVIPVKYNVVNFSKTSRRYYRSFDTKTIVGLDDFFSSQQKNKDYKSIPESDFSEEHLFYKKDGFVGFSDFLTVGDNYSESGFLPYAIAIHLSYADGANKIKVRHFVSDSNDDQSDIAGKFDEALTHLVTWCNKASKKTMAIDTFKELKKTGHFPGLGSVKKLSIENHIELVLSLI